MKSILAAFLFLVAGTTTYANDIQVSQSILKSFQKTYSQAKNVSWTKVDEEVYKASFTIDNRVIFAFYSPDGKLTAESKYIHQNQLPIALQSDLNRFLPAFRIQEVFEVNNEAGTTYYVTIVSAKKMIVLQSAFSQWNVFKKSKV